MCSDSRAAVGAIGAAPAGARRVGDAAQPVAATRSAVQTSRMWRKLAFDNRLGHLTLWLCAIPLPVSTAAAKTRPTRSFATIAGSRSPKRPPRARPLQPAAAVPRGGGGGGDRGRGGPPVPAWGARRGGGPLRRVGG